MITNTPPMGWNSWNTFGMNVTEDLIRGSADTMVKSGLKDAGYNYIVIDDGWSEQERDENGRLVPQHEKFPHGIKPVADYVHSKGLKFGIYSCAGIRTCGDCPGSFDHEFVDAQTFAEWNVDFLKYDYCFKPETSNGEQLYRRMSMALRASGRDILFSACNWGSEESEKWMRAAGADMYRSTGDIMDNYNSYRDITLSQIDKIAYSAPSCFNDMDMLVVGMYGKGNVGVGGCNDVGYRSHFALWCLFHSPLMIGCDIRSISSESLKLLTNRELITIDQDPECRPPYVLWKSGDTYTFVRLLSGNEYAIGMFNFNADTKGTATCMLTDAGLSVGSGFGMQLTDVFTHEVKGVYREIFRQEIQPHGCELYRGKLVRL